LGLTFFKKNMAIETWGLLTKSADDSTKIEEEIDDRIADHNADPDAHGLADMALYAHRTGDVLDHLDESITAAKIAALAVISQKAGYISFNTWFESIDGYDVVGTVDFFSANLRLRTSAASSSTSYIDKPLPLNLPGLTWDKHLIVEFSFVCADNTKQTIGLNCGGGLTVRHFGLKIVDDKLYASVGNGTAETTSEITGVDITDRHFCRIDFFPGVKADFYIDGVLKATISSGLPSGTITSNIPVYCIITTNEAVVKTMYIGHWDFKQDA